MMDYTIQGLLGDDGAEDYSSYIGGKRVHDSDFGMYIVAMQHVTSTPPSLTPNFAIEFVKPSIRMIKWYIEQTAKMYVAPVNDLGDAELEARAKSLLRELRDVQAEINRRYNARQTPAKAVCGHDARDKTGLYCDCPTCANYVPY